MSSDEESIKRISYAEMLHGDTMHSIINKQIDGSYLMIDQRNRVTKLVLLFTDESKLSIVPAYVHQLPIHLDHTYLKVKYHAPE